MSLHSSNNGGNLLTEASPLLPALMGDSNGNNGDDGESAINKDNHGVWSSIRNVRQSIRKALHQHVGSIGMLGSVSIAANSLTGPAMLSLPATFQKSGLVPTIVVLVFVCILSAFCSLHMANTISKVPGNRTFQKEVEFSDVFRTFWGPRAFIGTHIVFFCCVTCLNVSSIVDTAQVVDTFLGHWFFDGRGSGAIRMQWANAASILPTVDWIRWDYGICTPEQLLDGLCIPFSNEDSDSIILTVGYMVILAVFAPLALLDLKENAAWQVLGFLVLLACSVQFVLIFISSGIDFGNISIWGTDWDALFGVILFNFALVIAIPAWLYEREPHVNVTTVIQTSSVLTMILYIAIGLLGAMTMPNVSDNMLSSMMSGLFGNSLQIGASVFAFFIIGLGIPLFSVLARLNLTGNHGDGTFAFCSRRTGNLLAVGLPFGCSWLFYQGDAITRLLSWGGIIFTSVVAFILPLTLSLHTLEVSDNAGSVLDDKIGNHQVDGIMLTSPLDKKRKRRELWTLLILAILSILAAIIGNMI